eukprot:jgi/Chlat1/4057/Chrsp26S04109
MPAVAVIAVLSLCLPQPAGYSGVRSCHRALRRHATLPRNAPASRTTPSRVHCQLAGDQSKAGADSKDSSQIWRMFVQSASGEWDGYCATFRSDGSPQELPANVVPDAFKEWEVKLYDWQTQCSVTGVDNMLQSTIKRLLPTVGCEADASTIHDESVSVLPRESDMLSVAYSTDGQYSVSPAVLAPEGKGDVNFEHCLVSDNRERVRILQTVARAAQSKDWKLRKVTVYRERWDSEYSRGASLLSCGSKASKFAEGKRLESKELEGQWKAVDGVAVVKPAAQAAVHDALTRLLLPAGIWCLLSSAGGALCVEAGWVHAAGKRTVSARQFSAEGALQGVTLQSEERHS